MPTKARLKRIVRESMEQYRPQKTRNYNQVSDGMKSMANAAKRKFAKDYPEVKVKIDGRQGWIIVNDVKAVNVSSASSSPMSIEDMVDQMKQAYLGHPMAEAKLRSSIRRIIREEKSRLNELGIDRMTSGDNDPRLDDPDDLTLGLEVAEKMVTHLQAINDLVSSEAGGRSLPDFMDGGKYVTAEKFQNLLQWAEDNLAYWKMQ